jgi:transcription-repair coupling factor (superfamily II helicase)
MIKELKDKFKYANGISIGGLTNELSILYMLNFFEENKQSQLIVTSSLYEANTFFNLFQTYTNKVLLFPMDDFLTSVMVAESPELQLTRLETLKKIKDDNYIVITNLMGLLKFLPNKDTKFNFNLNLKDKINRNEIIDTLEKFGYHKESIVTSTGEYAVRGFIIDVFLVNEEKPIRIEIEDDVIDNIRYFDELTQMSINKIESINIDPIKEIKTDNNSSILDYLTNKNVFYIDNDQIHVAYEKIVEDIFEYKKEKNISNKVMFELIDIKPKFTCYIEPLKTVTEKNAVNYVSKNIDNYNLDFEQLKNDVIGYKIHKKEVYLALSSESEIKRIREYEIPAKIINFPMNKGFILDDLVVISDNDIEKKSVDNFKYKNIFKIGTKVKSYNQLELGDYVIHPLYGIGIYNGIVKLTQNKIMKDYIQILYADRDKIYVPVEKITNIYKYGDKDGTAPKINKLGSSNWSKTKIYLASKVKDISRELIELYKDRLKVTNVAYKKYPEQEIFANEFNYELTSDQKRSLEDIFHDLQSNYPMDRLLCGDVGFGKTEVAFETMFMTVLNNEQVMYLCPTTILSNQQYEVALKRFSKWPINIALLNRFTTESETKKILEGLKEGKIDIVFGTHRLLSNDIVFKQLGLLVVDEEQRFGVTHKEKIKKMKNDINVLTLSATPIPRTLKMSLSGIRDLSVINTAPINRYPVQTYVISENDLIIKDAIYKELSRNGQIFILYNHIESIFKQAEKIRELIPNISIACAHGQMKKDEIENIMHDFIQKKYSILMCTTIIENGIDIPNVNTLIIYDSDYFGLSQLYQIRGRVGRSDRIAYCYLTYKPNKALTENSIKRLNAIKEFTELGSGYKIAMRDLSIRGAGDIFGASQAGFVDSVGIDYYLKLMDDEIRRQKGEIVIEDDEDNQSLINVDTHISDKYVSDDDIKIEIHQRINEIDSIDKFMEVKKELEDRFGSINEKLENYMYEEWFEALAKQLEIKNVIQNDRLIEIEIPENISREIKGDKLLLDASSISRNISLKYHNEKIIITLNLFGLEDNYVVYLVKLLERIKENIGID